MNKFEIPTHLAAKNEQDCFAICVMMNNHIVDLKYFSDLFPDLDNEMCVEGLSAKQTLNKISMLMNDQKLISVIKRFKNINNEIVIEWCDANIVNHSAVDIF